MEQEVAFGTYGQQADALMALGLSCERDELVLRLAAVGYHRLCSYLRPLAAPDGSFLPGATLDAAWSAYSFDRGLRLLVLDAVGRVEVYVRARLAHELTRAQGPLGYLERENLPGLDDGSYDRFLERARTCYGRSRYAPAGGPGRGGADGCAPWPPYGILVETFDFGLTVSLYRGAPKATRKALANELGVQAPVLESWLRTLNSVRNACAHHDRLWNRVLGFKPMAPKGDPRWAYVRANNGRVYAVLAILCHLLRAMPPRAGGRDGSSPSLRNTRRSTPPRWDSRRAGETPILGTELRVESQ